MFLDVCMCMCVCLPAIFFPHTNLSPHLRRVTKNSLLNVSTAASMIVSEQEYLYMQYVQADIGG